MISARSGKIGYFCSLLANDLALVPADDVGEYHPGTGFVRAQRAQCSGAGRRRGLQRDPFAVDHRKDFDQKANVEGDACRFTLDGGVELVSIFARHGVSVLGVAGARFGLRGEGDFVLPIALSGAIIE
jgi:hypothetical protein